MRNKILICVLLTVGFSLASYAYVSAKGALEPAECFDYYAFGSVQVNINPELVQTLAGSQLRFYVTATNENPYPVVDGSIYVKIFRKQANAEMAQKNSGFLVDQFFVKENVVLDAGETKKFDFLWKVPAWAPEEDYQAFTYFQSAKKFDLLGLPFTDDIKGSRADFKIGSEFTKSVELDRNSVKVNGRPYLFAASPTLFEADENVKVEFPISNPTAESQSATVSYRLYWWSGALDSQEIDSKNETVILAPGEKKILSYEIEDQNYPVYYLVVDSKWNDYSSILGVRVARKELGRLRINFPGVTSFPITKGVGNVVFACLHNASLGGTADGRLELSILDKNGTQVEDFSYAGGITSAMMGLKGNFVTEKSYDKFTLKALLFDDKDVLVDSAELNFDCSEINLEECLPEEMAGGLLGLDPQMLKYIVIAAAILVVLIVIIMLIIKRKGDKKPPLGPSTPNTSDANPKELSQSNFEVSRESYQSTQNQGGASFVAMLGSTLLFMALVVLPIAVGARTTSYTVSDGDFDDIKLANVGVNTPSLVTLEFPDGYRLNYSFKYNAMAVADTGLALNDGDGVQVGSKISFYYDPNDFLNTGSDTSEWVELGQLLGTPFGHWVNNASFPYSRPPAVPTGPVGMCQSNDATQAYNVNEPSEPYDLFMPLSVDTPGVTIDVSPAVSSGVLGNCVNSGGGSRKTCDVLKAGPINAKVSFAASFAYHYIQYGNATCYYLGKIQKGGADFKIDIPAQNIEFSLSAVDGTGTIPAPVITGPTAGNPGIEYTFSARSGTFLFEDDGVTPKAQTVRYGFDWDNNTTVDFWTSWVNQGEPNSASFTWNSLGAKTFGVRTQDFALAASGWSYHSINITDNGNAVCIEGDVWTSCSATCGGGTRNLVHVDATCKTTIIDTETCNPQACGTVIIEVPPGG